MATKINGGKVPKKKKRTVVLTKANGVKRKTVTKVKKGGKRFVEKESLKNKNTGYKARVKSTGTITKNPKGGKIYAVKKSRTKNNREG